MIQNSIKKFQIYRFNPDKHLKPFYQTFEVDTKKMWSYDFLDVSY